MSYPAATAAALARSPLPQPCESVLTPREMEVLRLIVDGHSTKRIAVMLGISFKTAACHRMHIMQKLDIHEVASLVRYALREKLVDM
jgi:DNA-binding NarL/FixJ family response regulator